MFKLEWKLSLQNTIPRAPSDGEGNSPFGLPPSLRLHIPNRRIVSGQQDGHSLGFAGFHFHVVEAFENGRGLGGGFGHVEVQLWNLYSARERERIR
jgi:hypothetical protein